MLKSQTQEFIYNSLFDAIIMFVKNTDASMNVHI